MSNDILYTCLYFVIGIGVSLVLLAIWSGFSREVAKGAGTFVGCVFFWPVYICIFIGECSGEKIRQAAWNANRRSTDRYWANKEREYKRSLRK